MTRPFSDILQTASRIPPEEIEARSFAIIDEELPEPRPFSGFAWEVARRLIHTSGDISLPADLYLPEEALMRGIEALPIFGGPVTMNRCDDMAVPAAAVAHKDADTGLDRDFPCIRQQPQRPFDDPPRLSVFPHDCTGGIKRFIPSETVQLRRQRTAEHIDFTVDIFRHFHLTVTDKTGFFMLLLYPCCAGMSIPRNKKSGHIRLQTFRRDDRLVDYAKAGCEKGKLFEGRFFFGVRSRLPSSGKCCNSVSGVVIFRSISRTI